MWLLFLMLQNRCQVTEVKSWDYTENKSYKYIHSHFYGEIVKELPTLADLISVSRFWDKCWLRAPISIILKCVPEKKSKLSMSLQNISSER